MVDIEETSTNIRLRIGGGKEIPTAEFAKLPGFLEVESDRIDFEKLREPTTNSDTLSVVNKVKELLRKDSSPDLSPAEYYSSFMDAILSVGETYSSYIELILAHIFMVDDTRFWRYNQGLPIKLKLSEKSIAAKISPLLGFLFQPNRISIQGVSDDLLTQDIPDDSNLNFFEKIFLHKI